MLHADNRRLIVLGLLCAPGLGTAATLGLDTLTQRIFGSALTTWGFLGGLIGLAAFLGGYVSILAWPAVVVVTFRSARATGVPGVIRLTGILACLVATYSAAYFAVWFVILPWRAAH